MIFILNASNTLLENCTPNHTYNWVGALQRTTNLSAPSSIIPAFGGKIEVFEELKSTLLETVYNRVPYQKEVVHMFGLPEDRQHMVEIAVVSGTESAQDKQFPKQELRGYVHKV